MFELKLPTQRGQLRMNDHHLSHELRLIWKVDPAHLGDGLNLVPKPSSATSKALACCVSQAAYASNACSIAACGVFDSGELLIWQGP